MLGEKIEKAIDEAVGEVFGGQVYDFTEEGPPMFFYLLGVDV
jgi:hypothetical protein